jgi:hypothetical protein
MVVKAITTISGVLILLKIINWKRVRDVETILIPADSALTRDAVNALSKVKSCR